MNSAKEQLMPYFFCRLLPPRTTFMQDMSDDERKLMTAHGAYWKGLLDKGKAIVFGPVLDPQGSWGMGVLEATNEAEVQTLFADDPVSRAKPAFKLEVLPMAQAIYKK
jgi:uncharacterized protein YciI